MTDPFAPNGVDNRPGQTRCPEARPAAAAYLTSVGRGRDARVVRDGQGNVYVEVRVAPLPVQAIAARAG